MYANIVTIMQNKIVLIYLSEKKEVTQLNVL